MGYSREKDITLLRFFGDRLPTSAHNVHRESGKVRDGGATNDDSSYSNPSASENGDKKTGSRKEKKKGNEIEFAFKRWTNDI